jgi:hypothetical protein
VKITVSVKKVKEKGGKRRDRYILTFGDPSFPLPDRKEV